MRTEEFSLKNEKVPSKGVYKELRQIKIKISIHPFELLQNPVRFFFFDLKNTKFEKSIQETRLGKYFLQKIYILCFTKDEYIRSTFRNLEKMEEDSRFNDEHMFSYFKRRVSIGNIKQYFDKSKLAKYKKFIGISSTMK